MLKNYKTAVFTLFMVCLFSLTSGVYAFETSLRASRNMLTTKSATAVESNQWEFKLGMDYTRHIGTPQYNNNWATDSRPKMRLWDWQTQAAYGLAEGLDVFVSTGWFDIKDRSLQEGLDKYGRGVKDVTVGLTKELQNPAEHIGIAYIPELVIPVGRDAEPNGRIGLGRDFWEFNQTLAATIEGDPLVLNANLSHSIPFGRSRQYYATPYMLYRENVRGITALAVEALMPNFGYVQPMANLHYSHQWISHGSDSDLLTAGVGAKMQLTPTNQIMVGYDYPVAGRNSLRGQTWKIGVIGEF